MDPGVATEMLANYQAWLRSQLELQQEAIQDMHAELEWESERRLGLLFQHMQAFRSSAWMPTGIGEACCHSTSSESRSCKRAPGSKDLATCLASAGSFSSSMDQMESADVPFVFESVPLELEEVPPSQRIIQSNTEQYCEWSGMNKSMADGSHSTACEQQHHHHLAEALLKAKNWTSSSLEDMNWHETANPPPLETVQMRMTKFVEGRLCTVIVAVAICFNVLLMLLEVEVMGRYAHEAVLGSTQGLENGRLAEFKIAEQICTVIFLLEIILRTYAIRLPILRSFFFWIDLLCSLLAICEMVSPNAVPNVTFMRLIRLSKLTRVVKTSSLLSTSRLYVFCW